MHKSAIGYSTKCGHKGSTQCFIQQNLDIRGPRNVLFNRNLAIRGPCNCVIQHKFGHKGST